MKPLLQEQMQELLQWFNKVYPQHKLEIHTKWAKSDQVDPRGKYISGEDYILDVNFNGTAKAMRFFIPEYRLDDIEMRVAIKERWTGEMQQKIIQTIG